MPCSADSRRRAKARVKPRPPCRIFVRVVLSALGLALGASAYAQTGPAPAGEDKDRVIENLLRRVEALERKLEKAAGEASRPSPGAQSPVSPPPPSPDRAAANQPAEEETSRALERALIREGGLVLPEKAYELEPRLLYTYRSSNGLDIVNTGGAAQVARQDLKASLATASLALRVGLPAATQLEVVQPYSISSERRVAAGLLDESDRTSGFGGWEMAFTKQVLTETRQMPAVLGSLRFRQRAHSDDLGQPTAAGSSFRSVQGSAVVVKRMDPMVFIGSATYAHNYSRALDGSHIDPGDSIGIKLGSVLALSPRASQQLGVEFIRSAETSVNGIRVPGSSAVDALLTAGFSFVLSPRALLAIDLGFGLTSTSPDFRLGIAMPVRFEGDILAACSRETRTHGLAATTSCRWTSAICRPRSCTVAASLLPKKFFFLLIL
jgi:hypothetical protein